VPTTSDVGYNGLARVFLGLGGGGNYLDTEVAATEWAGRGGMGRIVEGLQEVVGVAV
jgi:hypothetical protein